jgi:uncharacterized protein YrrD
MRFNEGANVFTADGDKVGSLERVVIDPRTRKVTHVVVQKGFLFTEDTVVPISLIGAATKDRVTLTEDAGGLQSLPDFEETHYMPLDDAEAGAAFPAGHARPLYWYPSAGITWWSPTGYPGHTGHLGYPKSKYVAQTTRSIPEGLVALEEGAKVISSDNDHVGDVKAVLTDPKEDRATHLLITQGLLLKERKLVPTAWISKVREKKVHLGIGSKFVEQLPDYPA